MKKAHIALLTLLWIGFNLNAQTNSDFAPNNNHQSLNEITIQENRLQIPFSKQNRNITILDQQVIQSLPVKSINELLSYVAGIDIRQRGPWGAQTDIGIDGGTFDQTLVLINGIKISDPQTGHNMMNIPMSLNAIERIEILKGAAARVYGINALNGAINIITKQPDRSGVDINVFTGSSFEKDTSNQKLFGGYGIEAAASLSGENVRHFLSLSHMQSSGYRYNTAFNNEKAFYQNTINLNKDRTLSLLGGFVYNGFGANGFYAAPADIESTETVQTAVAGASATLPLNKYWTLRPRISYRYNHDDYIFIRQTPEVYQNLHATHVLNAELNNTFFTSAGNFGLGLELRNEAINSNSLGEWSRLNYGFFGEYSFNKVERLLINVGAYANYNSDFGWQVLPGIDIGYDLMKNIRIFANAGTGQRLPTYTDLYYKGPANIGNDQLMPEHSFHAEIGVKYNSALLNTSLSYFHRNTSDFIDWVKDSLNAPWQPQNFQEIKTDGISFSADYRFVNQQNSSNFSLLAGLSYTWLNPVILETEAADKISQYALENLRNQIAARTDLAYLNKYHLSLAARYQQRIGYKDYTVVDARFRVVMQPFELYADLTNLTNITYIEAGAVPMVGRWLTLGVKWNWWKG